MAGLNSMYYLILCSRISSADNILRTTFIYKVMYILDCEIIVSNSMKYARNMTIRLLSRTGR